MTYKLMLDKEMRALLVWGAGVVVEAKLVDEISVYHGSKLLFHYPEKNEQGRHL
jgi:hypothetical protein